jgi:hypothetical protein
LEYFNVKLEELVFNGADVESASFYGEVGGGNVTQSREARGLASLGWIIN